MTIANKATLSMVLAAGMVLIAIKYCPTRPIPAPGSPPNSQTPKKAADIGQNPVQGKLIRVTAYCPCEICCGKWSDGQTASGYWIQLGDRFVAAPKHIPFGTKFIVPGYNDNKPVKVLDRGGAITVKRLDVYFDTHQEALNWGVRNLEVKIVGE